MDCLMERMGSVPNLPVKQPIFIGTMLNSDGAGHGHGDNTCKQAFSVQKWSDNKHTTVVRYKEHTGFRHNTEREQNKST